MKIQIVSDLHLEFPKNREWIKNNPIVPVGDILLIAGDTVCDKYENAAADFYNRISEDFPFIISTMGNHEFYNGMIDYAYPSYSKLINKNHLHLNNRSFIYKEVKFIVSVLWSFVPDYRIADVESGLNDYHYIRRSVNSENSRKLRVADTNRFHQISVDFITHELNVPFSGKIVLLTHHLPSFNCIPDKFKGSSITNAFTSNLHEIMENNPKIALWACGHSHENDQIRINETIIARNPLGYIEFNDQEDFQLNSYLEV